MILRFKSPETQRTESQINIRALRFVDDRIMSVQTRISDLTHLLTVHRLKFTLQIPHNPFMQALPHRMDFFVSASVHMQCHADCTWQLGILLHIGLQFGVLSGTYVRVRTRGGVGARNTSR